MTPTVDRRLVLGVVGCGYWGLKLLRTFQTLPGARIACCYDTDPRRLAARGRPITLSSVP